MKTRYFWNTILLFSLIFVFENTIANEKIIFQQFTTQDGLSNGTVIKTFRDSKGFLWVCTEDGLNKYDGYNFKKYHPYVNNEVITISIVYNGIVEDKYGRIWLGSSIGLLYYDSEIDKLVSLEAYRNFNKQFDIPLVFSLELLVDHNDNLWTGSYNGLYKIKLNAEIDSINTEDIKRYTSEWTDTTSISNFKIISIVEDQQKNVWISSYSNYINRYNEETDNFERFFINNPEFIKSEAIRKKLLFDKNNDLWIYSEGKGILLWNRDKNAFKKMRFYDQDNNIIDTENTRSIIFDSNGRIWIGTDGNGIVLLNNDGTVISHYKTGPDDFSNLRSNAIYNIYEDYTGTFWIGTYLTGLEMVSRNKSRFGLVSSSPLSQRGLNNPIVKAFTEDQQGNIWISTDGGGINIYDPKADSYTHLMHNPNDPKSLSTNATTSIFADAENNIWVGTYDGNLNCFNRSTNSFDHYVHIPSDSTTISSQHPWGFAQDKWKNIWVATMNKGLALLKPGTKSFVNYSKNIIESTTNITSLSLNYIFIDSKQNLWVCSEYGLNKIDLNKVDFSKQTPQLNVKQYFIVSGENNRISFINEDDEGFLWIGTKGRGLLKMNPVTEEIKNYQVIDGLAHNTVHGILFDNDKNVWISTNNGLSRLNPSTEKFKNYDSSDGLQAPEFVKASCFKTNDGMLMFGGVNGYNAFFPNNITSNTTIPNVAITDFKLFYKSIQVGDSIHKRVLLPKAINEIDEIELLYNENIIAFEFTALDFFSPDNNQYAYKMEGFEDDWRYVNAKNRIATYTNLDPGLYTFKVKASNNEGVWNEHGKSVAIHILPPWWETWWFITIVVIAFILMLLAIYYSRVSTLTAQKKALEEMVDKRTVQLRKANVELKEINSSKDKFFSIIAHDIMSPFNTIIGFSEIMLQNLPEFKIEEIKVGLKQIYGSSMSLYDLLENLLHWAKSERGLIDVNIQTIDINKTIDKIITLFKYSTEVKKIELFYTKRVDVQISADQNLVNTILRNLVSNAIKFTPEGGQIEIISELKNDFVSIAVIDSGVGISKENIKKLMEAGTHHSTLGTNNEKGTGLGLIIIQEFIKKLGGEFSITSEHNKGSSFMFTIPVVKKE
ncbi:MAG: ATP-binding protein [Prolixibacteraceae bacterium]|jgi:signal transduction histidine kinase/ligand-binding sensor domain-containing protein|nr:ATP-binding protein [Prolixibacteraceae bacterium]